MKGIWKEMKSFLPPITCLPGIRQIFLHQMKEELKTLAGQIYYRVSWSVDVPYPLSGDWDSQNLFWQAKTERNCCGIYIGVREIWKQIFTVLKVVSHTYRRKRCEEAAGTAKVLSILCETSNWLILKPWHWIKRTAVWTGTCGRV